MTRELERNLQALDESVLRLLSSLTNSDIDSDALESFHQHASNLRQQILTLDDSITNNEELALLKEINELKEELNKKDELLSQYGAFVDKWKSSLAESVALVEATMNDFKLH